MTLSVGLFQNVLIKESIHKLNTDNDVAHAHDI